MLAGLVLADALLARSAPRVTRTLPAVLARGVGVPLAIAVQDAGGAVRVRQPLVPDLALDVREGDGGLAATLTPRRRGRHVLPAVALRARGPLGLGAWQHRAAGEQEVTVFPDLPSARRLALAVREGRFRDPGVRTRGPVGLGTEFERVRDYLPDDDIRQVNWRATARTGRPMSNQHRVEQDQEIMVVLDVGRLMAAPLGDRTRCDEALDAATALALVADELGDRCGALAFDDEIRRRVRPGRATGTDVIRATFDLEPSERDSDYELAFRTVGGGKRALVVVLTDLLDEAAARALVDAVPVLTRRHAVLVASARDPESRPRRRRRRRFSPPRPRPPRRSLPRRPPPFVAPAPRSSRPRPAPSTPPASRLLVRQSRRRLWSRRGVARASAISDQNARPSRRPTMYGPAPPQPAGDT